MLITPDELRATQAGDSTAFHRIVAADLDCFIMADSAIPKHLVPGERYSANGERNSGSRTGCGCARQRPWFPRLIHAVRRPSHVVRQKPDVPLPGKRYEKKEHFLMLTRRELLVGSGSLGAGTLLPGGLSNHAMSASTTAFRCLAPGRPRPTYRYQ